MIIACPACNTRYVVPDTAIGVEGRTVRCAKCRHSWHQDGNGVAGSGSAPVESAPPPRAAPQPPRPQPQAASAKPTVVETPVARPAPGEPNVSQPDGAAEGAALAAGAGPAIETPPSRDFDETDPPFGDIPAAAPAPYADGDEDDEVSRFDHAPPFGSRRNMGRIWTVAAITFAALATGLGALVYFAGVPEWLPIARPLFGAGTPDLKLEFPVAEQDRRTLPNGTEFFGARIKVTNTARESRTVPDILIVLRDQRERQVYSWVVAPPQSTLGPGATVTINEAVTDVPKSAVFADIGWAPR